MSESEGSESQLAYWQVSPGEWESDFWPEFRKAHIIAMGWDKLGNLRDYQTDDEIEKALKKHYPEDYPEDKYPEKSIKSIRVFSQLIEEGHIIVAKKGSSREIYGIGRVLREYHYEKSRKDFKHVIDVDWIVGFDERIEVDVSKRFVQWTADSLRPDRFEQIRRSVLKRFPELSEKFDSLMEGGRQVAQAVASGNWWIEKTIVRGRPDRETGDYQLGRALWSPQKDGRGADIYRNMRALKKGNIVLHLVDNEAIVGVSIVDAECDSDFHVLQGTEWDDGTGQRPGYLVTLKGYERLMVSLNREEILQEKYRQSLTTLLNEGHDLFFTRSLNLRQGAYLTKVPAELLRIINEAYRNKTGQDLPHVSGVEPWPEDRKYALLWSVRMDTHPRVIEYHQEHIQRMSATYWGVGFSIDKTRFTLPTNGYLYTTDSRKVTHVARVEDVEAYGKPQMPKELSLRPPEYKSAHPTYFKFSKLERLPVPLEIHSFTQWNGEKVVRPPQNYVLVMEPQGVEVLKLLPSHIKTKLSIAEDVLHRISAGLNSGSHMIVTGPVGTGKTTLIEDVCHAANENKFCSGYVLTTASSDWTTFDTIGGYMPTEDGRLKFEEGKFLEAIRHNKWLIIDEINRADIDKAFGQLFTVLSGQKVELPFKHPNGEGISIEPVNEAESYFDDRTATYKVGKNWRILATMNIYDMNFLFEMSYAFMRRFAFVYLDVPEDFETLVGQWCEEKQVSDKTRDKLMGLTKLTERKMGPAIIKDMIEFIEHRGDGEKELAEAIVAYILPQLEGLERERIEKTWNEIGAIFEAKNVPNGVVYPVLKEIVGIALNKIPEETSA